MVKPAGDEDFSKLERPPKASTNVGAMFALEAAFPSIEDALKPFDSVDMTSRGTLISLDTNALLLPYEISNKNLAAVTGIYKKLRVEERLFLSARVVREFANRRERHLADIIKALADKKSATTPIPEKLSPLLNGMPDHDELAVLAKKINEGLKQYNEKIQAIVSSMSRWRGDDPVSTKYHELFSPESIVELTISEDNLAKEWALRRQTERPPGYKDGGKPDTGIGDFLIWMSILQLGKEYKRDLVFVTGETKADWMVRSDKVGIFPRPELMHEYRSVSEGKSLRLATLSDLLNEMGAENQVVEEVVAASEMISTSIGMDAYNFTAEFPSILGFKGAQTQTATFDHEGAPQRLVDGPRSVTLSFSARGRNSLYVYSSAESPFIATLGKIQPYSVASFVFEGAHSAALNQNDVFAAKQPNGTILLGKFTSINYLEDGTAKKSEATLRYRIYAPGEKLIMPL